MHTEDEASSFINTLHDYRGAMIAAFVCIIYDGAESTLNVLCEAIRISEWSARIE